MKPIKKPNLSRHVSNPSNYNILRINPYILYTATEFNGIWDEYNLLVAVLVIVNITNNYIYSSVYLFQERDK